jgi:hypothetical protein
MNSTSIDLSNRTQSGCGQHIIGAPLFTGWLQLLAGIAAGFVIGVIASLLGVAGGEFLIPTLVLLFGADIKLAGSLSLASKSPHHPRRIHAL